MLPGGQRTNRSPVRAAQCQASVPCTSSAISKRNEPEPSALRSGPSIVVSATLRSGW